MPAPKNKTTPTPIANREAGQAKSGRVTRKRVPSEEVQGEGTWVEVLSLKYGESKALQREVAAATSDAEKALISERLIQRHILAWNWTDDEGTPLLPPKQKPEVVDELTADEMVFLANCLKPNVERGKSLPPS